MLLELTVVSYHRLSSRQEAIKTFDQFGGTIGRAETSDWYLPDPERVVSGTHARIDLRDSSFYITDLSTNGVYVNRSVQPLGADNAHRLADGDFLALGEYEIEVRLIDGVSVTSSVTSSPTPNAPDFTHEDKSLISSSAKPNKVETPVPSETLGMGIPLSDLVTPQQETNEVFTSIESIQSVDATDVSSTLDDHFLPPAPQIPEEWDKQFSTVSSLSNQPAQVSVNSVRSSESVNSPSNVNSKFSSGDEDPLASLLKGMGITPDMIPSNANELWWEQLGGTFRELLLGLMDVLRNRSDTKSEFRVNQTTFKQQENNPLKFSASIDDAFHNLFNRSGSSFLPAKKAVQDAFNDINLHEEAIMAGAKGAVGGVLHQLSPESVQSKYFGASLIDKVAPAKRQARYWAIYKELHKDLQHDFSSEADRSVNDEFTAAYEAALKKQ